MPKKPDNFPTTEELMREDPAWGADSAPLKGLDFARLLDALQEQCFVQARDMGFWDDDMDQPLSKLMLVVTELAEAAEGYRKPTENFSEKIPGFTLVEEEIADVYIRLMDLSGRDRLRIGLAIIHKLRYNATRSYRHGGKRF